MGRQERPNCRAGVPPWVHGHRDDLELAGLGAEAYQGVVQVGDDQRAQIGAVVIDEGQQHGLASELGEPDEMSEGVFERELRRLCA